MKNDKRRIAIYSRKSKFTNKGESIENQIGLCREYIRLHYGQELAESALVYEDEGFSGGNIERPQFKEMIEKVRKREIFTIICYRLDRISRNIGDFACLIEELNDLDISLISLKEQFDTASPMGRAMMYIASVFSQLERETIADRIQDNMYELAKTGRWLGGVTPTGYSAERIENIVIDGKSKELCKLTIIPNEAEIVKLIFSLFIDTESISKTITQLSQKGYRTKNNKRFSRISIKNILLNPVYMIADEAAYDYWADYVNLYADKSDFNGYHGISAFNKTLQKTGKATSTRNLEDWIVSVGLHQGIIPGIDWIRAQRILEQNRSSEYSKPRSDTALLTGFIKCAECGRPMRCKVTKRLNAEGERIYSYICTTREKSKGAACSMKATNGNTLDTEIINAVKKLLKDSEFLMRLQQNTKSNIKNSKEYKKDISELELEIADITNQINKLLNSLANASNTVESYIKSQIEELHARKKILTAKLGKSKKFDQNKITCHEDEISSLISAIKDFDNLNVAQKRYYIKLLMKEIIWNVEQLIISYSK